MTKMLEGKALLVNTLDQKATEEEALDEGNCQCNHEDLTGSSLISTLTMPLWAFCLMMGLAMLGAGVVGHFDTAERSNLVSHPRRLKKIEFEEYPSRQEEVDRWWSEVEHYAPGVIKGLPNIMFIKPHKVGSSSMSIVLRLIAARNNGVRREYMYTLSKPDYFYALEELQPLEKGLHLWGDHQTLSTLLQYGKPEIIEDSFKITLVRDPLDRCLSSFYYYVLGGRDLPHHDNAPYEMIPEEELTQMKLDHMYCGKSIDLTAEMTEVAPNGSNSSVEDVLAFYDLIAVTGRYMESLAVLQMQLGLRYGDMLYFDTKYHPSYRPPVSEEPPEVIEHMKSLIPQADWDLYHAVDKRLSKTIHSLEPKFTAVHNKLMESLTNARLECVAQRGYRLLGGFACFGTGGCRISCLNKFATDHDLWDTP